MNLDQLARSITQIEVNAPWSSDKATVNLTIGRGEALELIKLVSGFSAKDWTKAQVVEVVVVCDEHGKSKNALGSCAQCEQ